VDVLNPRRWPSWWPVPAAVALVVLLGVRHSRKAPLSGAPAWLSQPYPVTTTQAALPPGWQLHSPGVGGTGIWPAGRFFRATLSSAVPFPVTWTQSDDLTSVVEGLNGA
jgi:hypothetical protein